MARLVRHFVEDARPCSYLPNANAALEYRLMLEVSPHELEMMLQRGWRRFGPAYFRPSCNLCTECQSIRIDVENFAPSRSQRRALKRAQRFRIAVTEPRVDAQRLALHARWHANREERRQWESTNLTEDEYATQFASPSHTGREVAWYDGNELVALGLVDLTPRSVSAAYFFYDPRIAASSPGIGNVMHCVELARELGARYVYLGYMVEGCRSLAYKSSFRPQERLVGRPSMSMEPIWSSLP